MKFARQLSWFCFVIAILLTACTQVELPTSPPLIWQAANSGLVPHAWITTIAVDPKAPNHIYAGSYGRDSLYESNNGGDRWHRAGNGVNGQPLFKLLFDPQDDKTLWAATSDGLYRGTLAEADQNRKWQRVAEWPAAAAAFALVDAQGAGATLFAAGADRSIWATLDSDEWWSLSPLPDEVGAILAVAVAADIEDPEIDDPEKGPWHISIRIMQSNF